MSEPIGSFINRRFTAPPDAVFDAWVTPTSFATWWGGSEIVVPLDSVSMDVRPGGTWKATMILGDDMPSFHWRGEYLEVDRPNKLVLTMTDEPGDAREHITVTLTAVDGGTEMAFSQTGGHLSGEEYEGATIGWQTCFDALDMIFVA